MFDYSLEDTDHIEGGADVFNGQESVVWNNIRDAFGDEIASMYQTLRSQGKLSYNAVEAAFENHQNKWSEAIFNEDSWFKYIDPLIEDGNGAYLEMMQGSKKEQRKWWLYNRFRYIDSKYNAGDALTDVIQLRGYAKANITVTPYADIYPTVKYGSYLVHQRGQRGVATTLVNPLDNVNDTEIYIYSSSQLASVGDLSGLLVGFADFSMATKLQELKIGSDAVGYSNNNLKTLTLGNNVLLKKIDVRNCVGLGTGDQKSVDISGCTNIEEIYFDGTNITGLQLPNGGIIKKLHLPATVTNLTVMNQQQVTEFVIPTYQNISTLRLENVSSAIDEIEILKQIPANSRVRLIGFYMLADDAQEIDQIFDILDTMRGLDEAGNNMETAQVSGEIHTASLTGAEIAEFNQRYPYVRVTADHTSAVLTYKTYDGATTLFTETVLDGGNGTRTNTTARTSTAQYSYTPDGWSLTANGSKDANALVGIVADRTVYASYIATLRKYTITWKNADNTTLETDQNVPYGSTPQYNGATPTYQGQTSIGWNPTPSTVVGNATYTATYLPVYTVRFYNQNGTTLLQTSSVVQGQSATYTGATPTNAEGTEFLGWATSTNSSTVDASLSNIQANTDFYAAHVATVEVAEITDTWDQIIANIDNGTYATKYKIGNYKPLDLGSEGIVNMQIVAFDTDELADGSGTAPITFIGMELVSKTPYQCIPYFAEHYPSINSRLQLVSKYRSRIPSGTGRRNAVETLITSYACWAVSLRELGYSTYESHGVTYSDIYNNDESRIKKTSDGIVRTYGTDSAVLFDGSQYFFAGIDESGDYELVSTSYVTYCTIGFCLGYEADTITDSWDTIIANTSPETSYSIGDTKWMTLSNGEKVLMQIAGFNCDELASGNGVARISWISKYLLDNTQRIGNVSGGWEGSRLRTYLTNTVKPMLPANIRNGIQTVKKYSSTYENGALVHDGQITNDDLWIPNIRELFNSTNMETQGTSYPTLFTDNDSRKKAKLSASNSFIKYWCRSVKNSGTFNCILTSGSDSYDTPTTFNGVALGFCTGVKTN